MIIGKLEKLFLKCPNLYPISKNKDYDKTDIFQLEVQITDIYNDNCNDQLM